MFELEVWETPSHADGLLLAETLHIPLESIHISASARVWQVPPSHSLSPSPRWQNTPVTDSRIDSWGTPTWLRRNPGTHSFSPTYDLFVHFTHEVD